MTVVGKDDPTPYDEEPSGDGVTVGKVVGLMAGTAAVVLVPLMCLSRPTRGATQSSRIEWERRQALIREAAAENPTASAGAAEAAGGSEMKSEE